MRRNWLSLRQTPYLAWNCLSFWSCFFIIIISTKAQKMKMTAIHVVMIKIWSNDRIILQTMAQVEVWMLSKIPSVIKFHRYVISSGMMRWKGDHSMIESPHRQTGCQDPDCSPGTSCLQDIGQIGTSLKYKKLAKHFSQRPNYPCFGWHRKFVVVTLIYHSRSEQTSILGFKDKQTLTFILEFDH